MEVLIKFVLFALPVYSIGCFLLPKENISRIHQSLARFWWGQRDDIRKTHWINWKKLCPPKEEGDLGFRDFQTFNQALLARQSWQIFQNSSSILFLLYQGKYFHSSSFLSAELGNRPSWGWRSVLAGRDLLLKGLRWQIGSGESLLVFSDHWLPTNPPRPPTPITSLTNDPPILRVSDLILHGTWITSILGQLITPEDIQIITSIPLPISPIPDRVIWFLSQSGGYTVQSGYQLAYPTTIK
ncbi:Uncharacterized mitochondrial protein AtMg00310 [Linum grandiflorum]